MSHIQHRLTDTLQRISVVLGATPEQHAQFEKWALEQLRSLLAAERESRKALQWKTMVIRQEYLELQKELSTGISVTGRTELLRAARKEWLHAVLELVDELLEQREAA
ncbi:MAG: hypothetical protein ACOZQL_31015 [Myxococcota bacterium]